MEGSGDPFLPGTVLFIGAVHEAQPALLALLNSGVSVVEVITLPKGSGQLPSGYVDLEPLARAHGVRLRRCRNVNRIEEIEHVRELAPDLLVVVGWTRLLGEELLGIPLRGCVGFHASLLPRYRGRAPVNWSILRGERETGNTMMYLDVGTDTGDIIDQRPVQIGPDDTCRSVYARIGLAGAEMLRDHLPALLAGTAPRRPQEHDGGEVLPKRTPEMGITDWNRPARAVHDWIRALTHPYPGAFSYWHDRKVMLWGSSSPATHPGARAGEVIKCSPEGIRVGTSDGSVLLSFVSEADDQPIPASDWIRVSGMAEGDRFEPVDEATARWALGLGPNPAGVAPVTRP
jgi:methionyl-tRNA formyltransferase